MAHAQPDVDGAVASYVQQTGGQITDESQAGRDLLENYGLLAQRQNADLVRLTNSDPQYLFSH
uniref:Uncharacterized protein n=1 Tax=Romanomermis culicivorax TaxID=13658 RepID=A0A915IND3_ROMCU